MSAIYIRDTSYDVRLTPECSALGYRMTNGSPFRVLSDPSQAEDFADTIFDDMIPLIEPCVGFDDPRQLKLRLD
jgi:hypothetical protein